MINQLLLFSQKQKITRSKILIGFLISFLSGIFLGDFIKIDPWWLASFTLGMGFGIIIFWKDLFWRFGLFLLFGFFLSLSFYVFYDQAKKEAETTFNHEVTIEGEILGHPDILSDSARYVVKFEKQKIQIYAGRYPEYHYGDILRLKGIIKTPNNYQFHQGMSGVIYNPENMEKISQGGNVVIGRIYQIRDRFEDSLNKTLSEPYASFGAGLLLGSKRNIPDSLMADFNRTGTTHIVAVSGYNVTIIILALGGLLAIISRKVKFWGSLVIILGFVTLTGAPDSVVRAGILAGLVIWGQYEGRRINLTILLLLVAFLMLLFNPYALKYDLSFQLSFLAFIGLVYLAPVILKLKVICWLPEFLRTIFAETLAAQIMVLPILIFNFGRLSLISPIANILILWLIPTTMLMVFLIGLFGLIWFQLGYILGLLGAFLLKYIIVVVEGLSKLSWASYELKLNSWWWMPFYFLVLLIIIRKSKLNRGAKLDSNTADKLL